MRTPAQPTDYRSGAARAELEAGVVRIAADEYETALAVAAGRATSAG